MSETSFPFDPEEIRLENEMRKLQLEKEFGMNFGHLSSDLPPFIENQFLRHVLEYEKKWQTSTPTSPREVLGNPEIPSADSLKNPEDFIRENTRIMRMLREHQINVAILGPYTHEKLFDFLVNTVLDDTDFTDFGIPGMFCNYEYDEQEFIRNEQIEDLIGEMLSWFEMGLPIPPASVFADNPEGQMLLVDLIAFRKTLAEVTIIAFDLLPYSVQETETTIHIEFVVHFRCKTLEGIDKAVLTSIEMVFLNDKGHYRIAGMEMDRFTALTDPAKIDIPESPLEESPNPVP